MDPVPEDPKPRNSPEPGREDVPFQVGPGDRQPYEEGHARPLPGTEELFDDASPPDGPNRPAAPNVYSSEGASSDRGLSAMPQDSRPQRRELLPGADPEKIKEVIFAPEEVDPDDPESVWLLGNDPEADAKFVRDRRSDIRRQLFSTGAQFVVGLIMAIISLGLVIMAITNPIWQYIVPAAVIAPIGAWFFRVRWRRWLGSAPYMYRLLSSLGEDAENVLVEHKRKQRAKYVKKVGTLYGDSFGDQVLADEEESINASNIDIPDDFQDRL